ncbi:MAG: NHLP bacteriocin export ABC transporter permease/ATPase subunit [Pseudodesulfovibrio sp.]|nr:NHLP bacteriocin export ABC transporter permease/ATPase subunit [Pseudodesulfovibrio sp.]
MSFTAPKRRIDLDSTGMVWHVKKGKASVMVEPAPGSDLPRTSETLLRVQEGGYIFGFSSEGMTDTVQVFLESSPGAKLVPMLTEDFIENCQKNPDNAAKIFSHAIRQLSTHFSPDIPPPDVKKMLKPGSNFRLPGGMKASALSDLWFRMDKGNCVYGDAREVGILGNDNFLPLCGNMWVELDQGSRLICVDTSALIQSDLFFDAFASFAAMAVTMTFEKFSQMALGKFMRLMESSKHRSEEFNKALNQAVEVVNPDTSIKISVPTVTEAVRSVGKALGCKVVEPPRLKADMKGQLEDILNHNGFYARDILLSGRWFEEDSGPLLGFMEQAGSEKMPIALLPGKKGYVMLSPKTGRKEPITEELAAQFAEKGLQLYPPLPAGVLGPLNLTMHSLKGCGKEMTLVVLMGLLGGLSGFGIPMAMSTTVDKVISNGEHGLLWQILFGLTALVLGSATFELTKTAALLRMETRAQVSLQSSIFGKLLKLPVDFFKKYPAGDLSNRAMAVDGIRQSLSGTMLVTLLSSTFALTNLVLLAFYSWQLSLAVLIILMATLAFTFMLMKGQMKFQSKVQNVIGKLAGLELQLITGINKLRAAGAETNAFARWMENFSELRKITYAIGKGTNVITVYASGLPLFSSLMVFGLFILTGMYMELSLGSFLCFNSAMGQLTGAVATMSSTAISLIFIKPMYERAKPILEAKPETHAALEDPGKLHGSVEAVNVSFAYEGATQPTLRNVSFKANPGEFVAIVGPSGSGKSTLLKLFLGFYNPNAGAILFDSKPMRRLDPVKVRRQIGSVIQNGELIQGNIYFNIMGATSDAEEEDAWEAARLAAVDEDIKNMPMGMHTFVPHGGSTFSGGQKQRIMIARALSKKPRIFLLDEATSSLDNTSQAQVMRNLRHINATRIVVAHRLSTIQDADRIYVMHQGQVAESGTFTELMEKGGLFSKLASRQMD